MSVNPTFLQTAIELALRAGEMQMARREGNIGVGKKGPIDLVTQVDLEVERMGRALIADRFPTHAVLAEELPNAPGTEQPSSGYCWILDPIDGTVNYAHGLPVFCCSLALEIEGTVEIGVIYDPSREELFVAERGCGARLNGSPISVSSTEGVVDSLLCTGFPYDVQESVDEVVGLFSAFICRGQAIRRLGSAALDLCYVAAGRFDGFWEQRLKPWDTAAGALMVTEAGGRVTDMLGVPFLPRVGHVLATNGLIHDEMQLVIEEFSRSQNQTG